MTCPICDRGAPLGILVERPTTWITSDVEAPGRGYLCVVAKRHVVEPFELEGGERSAFWEDVLFAAERLTRLAAVHKLNYEIHGNTLAHLHAHVYALDSRFEAVENVPLGELRAALSG